MSSGSETAHRRERLFFALWPDDALRARFARQAARLGKACGGRRVAEDNLHVTLAFLGAVTAPQRACIEAAASLFQGGPFELNLDQVGFWARPRVLWLGSSDAAPTELLMLVAALRAAMADCGLEPETRPFETHVTLRRAASHGPHERHITPIPWPVADFALVHSRTLPEGACYTVLRRWPLAGPPCAMK